MAFNKTFDELLSDILTDYRNQFPAVDTAQGTLTFIKAACLASALWGLYKYQAYIAAQVFPDTADSANLDHHARIYGLTRAVGESDTALLARLLSRLRRPPAGGNRFDYEAWALESAVAADAVCQITPASLSAFGVDAFSAESALDNNPNSVAWYTDYSSPGAWIQVDFGAGHGNNLTRWRLYTTAAGLSASYDCQFSDDGISWTTAAEAFVPSAAGWSAISWPATGVHRYWRLLLTNAPGAGPGIAMLELRVGAETCVEAVCIPTAQGPGTVDVVAAGSTSDGAASDVLLATIGEHIDDVRPVTAYETRVLSPTITRPDITVVAYGSAADISRTIFDISALVGSLRIGQPLYRASLVAIAMGNGAANAVVSSPASDIVPGQYGLVRCGAISVVEG